MAEKERDSFAYLGNKEIVLVIIMNTIKIIRGRFVREACSSLLWPTGSNLCSINKQFSSTVKKQRVPDLQSREEDMTREQVLKTYLQIIPPYKLQALLNPERTDISQYTNKPDSLILGEVELEKLYKKIKKSAHIITVQNLTQLLDVLSHQDGQSQQCKSLQRKIYSKVLAAVERKLNLLTLEQIVNFVYKLVKLNHKEFEFMKEVEKIIIQEKIQINYPLIRKILWSYTHLDVGSSVLYSHICRTLKIGQHEFMPLELAQAAYMLSKTSENAAGGYGIFLIAQKHLLNYFPRLKFSELVKSASFMFTQNLGTNDFQQQLEMQLCKKYPDRANLRINDLVSLLKSTSAYYFKHNNNELLSNLQSSTHKFAPEANLQQFQDIVWSWGRAGKGDRDLWVLLEDQINKKYINILKPRQLAFFYYSLCCSEHTSKKTINLLEQRFLSIISQTPDINEHYLLKFLLGMQKRKDFSKESFAKVSHLIGQRLPLLSVKQLVTFAKIINESDLCYEDKDSFKQMEKTLHETFEKAVMQRVYMFRISEIVEILYMWIKLDISGNNSSKLEAALFEQIENSLNQVPKSVFLKALFCMTIKDKYREAVQMVGILQDLMQFGQVGYFFSPFDLPLAAYSVFHLVVNSKGTIKFNEELLFQLGKAIEQINPSILNKFVRNGYDECLKLKQKYENNEPKPNIKPKPKPKRK